MKVLVKLMDFSGVKNIYADEKTGEFSINSMLVNYDAEKFVSRVCSITLGWKNEYINNSVLDGVEYRIKLVSDNGKERVIVGKNKYPSNYDEFAKVIGEVLALWN